MIASEARRVFEENRLKIDFVYEQIKNCAKSGNNYANFPDSLEDKIVTRLINEGYTISKFVDPYGIEVTKVKW